ncbi:peptide/nickel transport system substrate-binding protein [Sporosarcina luteola]|nr:peptide/nickel transport system substrate-binding protein [Sporosarcina luteola]
MRITRNVLLVIISSLLLLSACGKGDAQTGTDTSAPKRIVYGTDEEIKQINPVLTDAQEIDRLLFRGLTQPTENNEIVPDLAASWDITEDQLTYTFTLREDAQWEDGEPVTADDVKFTLDAIIDPETNTPIAGEFNEIQSVTVIDPHQLEITLKNPFPALLGKLQVGIVPKHLLESQDINQNDFNQSPVGNGPFKIKSWDADHTVTLERSETYYGTKPKIDEIVFKPVLDANTRVLQLKTGEIDLALLGPNQLKSIHEKDHLAIYSIPTADYRAVLYNFNKPLFKDPLVRQAMNFAIDREAIVKGLLNDKGQPAYSPLQKSWALTDTVSETPFQPDKTKQLLTEAGWSLNKDGIYEKDGQQFEFDLYTIATDPVRVALANIVSEQLKPLGIIVHPKPSSWDAIDLNTIDSLVIGWGSENDPDDHTYRLFHSSQIGDGLYNMGSYENPEVDKLLEAARTTDDIDERKKWYGEFQEALTEDPPFNFLVYLDAVYAANDRVTGIGKRTLGHHGFGIVWNIEDWDVE